MGSKTAKTLALILVVALFGFASCKCRYSASQVPAFSGTKSLSYTFAGYTDNNGKKTFKMYVADTTYSADAKKYFDIFRNAVILSPSPVPPR